jgi:uncharacterized membrane protein
MVVLAVGLTLTVADVPMAWLVWPLGYGVALPLAIGYAKRDRHSERRESNESTDETELDAVRQRYVDGDIDEREFEAALERALGEESR